MRHWKIANAKQKFSDLVRASAQEPQLILNRDKLVAAIVDGDTFESYQRWHQRDRVSLGDAFRELRRISAEEDYTLPNLRW